ncbi:MAG: hypothetical protein ACLQIQ_12755 [Beijerinckiaceae bacterium]
MPSDMCKPCLWLVAGAAGAALVLAAGLGGAGPALAGDDGSPFSSVLGFFGAPLSKPEETIDYQPRPPLVVPPKLDLPKPQAKAPHGAEWPNDPDAAARRKAEADSRRPAPQVTVPPPPGAPESVLVKMKDYCPPGSKTCIAPEDSFWEKLTETFTFAGGPKEVVLSGAEPNRDYLVDPPPGYRRPLAVPEKAPPPPQQQAQTSASATTQPPDANLKTAQTPAPQAPAPQAPAPEPQKEHFGLW